MELLALGPGVCKFNSRGKVSKISVVFIFLYVFNVIKLER